MGGGGGGGGGSITVAEDMRPYDGGAERGAGDADLLFGLPGGGACELQMAAGVQRVLAVERGRTSGKLVPERVAVLEHLHSALMAVPQQIHMNAHRASALDSFGGRWPVLLHSITAEHAASKACALGLVVEKTAEGIGLLEVQSAVHAGVIEPFHAKLRLVDGVLTCLAQLLALDGAVAVRRLPTRRGQRTPLYGVTSSLAGGKPRRRRRFDDAVATTRTGHERR